MHPVGTYGTYLLNAFFAYVGWLLRARRRASHPAQLQVPIRVPCIDGLLGLRSDSVPHYCPASASTNEQYLGLSTATFVAIIAVLIVSQPALGRLLPRSPNPQVHITPGTS
jgi:hypothetical protein